MVTLKDDVVGNSHVDLPASAPNRADCRSDWLTGNPTGPGEPPIGPYVLRSHSRSIQDGILGIFEEQQLRLTIRRVELAEKNALAEISRNLVLAQNSTVERP